MKINLSDKFVNKIMLDLNEYFNTKYFTREKHYNLIDDTDQWNAVNDYDDPWWVLLARLANRYELVIRYELFKNVHQLLIIVEITGRNNLSVDFMYSMIDHTFAIRHDDSEIKEEMSRIFNVYGLGAQKTGKKRTGILDI